MTRAVVFGDRAFLRRGDDAADRTRLLGVGVAVVLHVALFAALWQYAPLREAISDMIPVTVSLITPPAPEPPKVVKPPVVPPMRPRVAPVPPPIEAPVLAVPPEAPATAYVPPPPPPAPPSPPPEAPAAPAAIVAVAPPRFDADYLQNPVPVYPPLSRRNGEQGKVLLHVLVEADGHAQKVELSKSSGFERLDNAALDTVARWRFVPARQGERPVAGWVLIPISFVLKG
jgi:protein TonB